MKRTVRVSAGFSGKVPTGQFQNMNPSFHAEVLFELDTDEASVSDRIGIMQRELQAICYGNFEAEALKAKRLKVQVDLKDIHWYDGPNGEKWPGVTSIINYDTTFFHPEEEMKEYAAQGTIIDAQVKHFIQTGEWKSPSDLPIVNAEVFIVKTGKLGLSLDGWDFLGFLNKYPLEKMEIGTAVVNKEHQYGGTPDVSTCLFKGIPTIADVKRTASKDKNFMQMAAYEMARRSMGMKPNEQMMVIPLNDKTEQGFSKPIGSKEIQKYFDLFLYKRKEFKKVYGI